MSADARRRSELREFLTSRRARINPEDVDMPAGSRRRTPGLRREEVAVLAGVSASWYQWLEQGRDISVSPQVLDAVARTLRLDEAERRHLYVLAGLNPPVVTGPSDQPVDETLLRLVEGLMPMPAMIQDRYWNMSAYNEAARLIFDITGPEHNGLACFFTNTAFRSSFVGWADTASRLVAQFRAEMSAQQDDPGFADIVDRLSGISPEFAEMWGRHEVRSGGFVTKIYMHPTVGRLDFEITQLRVPERPDLTVVLDNPTPGTDTAAKIAQLLEDHRGLRLATG
jgi:transcriptional regulator with XRE-family HTH domain